VADVSRYTASMLNQTTFANPEIQSITTDDDSRIIAALLVMHSPKQDPFIVDCTYCDGIMWNGCSYQPDWKIDNRDIAGIDAVDDFTKLESVKSADVLVFDPPHLPTHAASEQSSKIWEHRYGITDSGEGREGDNVSGLFIPFLLAARRVLSDNGIVLAKIADLTHNHRYQWQHIEFVKACEEQGFTACDMVIKWSRAGNLKSSKWVNTYHARKSHSFWIVARKGDKCERPSAV
jgi:hypothetical protein